MMMILYISIFSFMSMVTFCCESGWKAHRIFCYKQFNNKETFIHAKSKCHLESAELVMVKTQEEMDFIEQEFDTSHVWIGLRNTSPGDSTPKFVWEDGTSLNFIPSNSDFNKRKDEEDCVAIERRGKWRPRKCDRDNIYICQKLLTLYECPSNWNRSYTSRTCYQHTGYGTIKKAKNKCSGLADTSAKLVMPKTEQENIYLTLLMNQWNEHVTHIGLKGYVQANSIDYWEWFDGERLDTTGFTDWVPGMLPYSIASGTECVYAARRDKWIVSNSSGNTFSIICQCYLPDLSPVVQVSIDSYCTPPDSANILFTTNSEASFEKTSSETYTTSRNVHTTVTSTETPDTSSGETTSTVTQSTMYNTLPEGTTVVNKSNTISIDTCSMKCSCDSAASPTESEVDQRISDIKANLTVERATLSSTIRKLTCADDPRPSSRYIGYVGALLMAVPLTLTLTADLLKLGKFLFC